MTATRVNGREVIAVEPALSPLSEHHGKPIYFKQIVRLLLDDGSEVYGCVHCNFTAPHTQFSSHFRLHNPPKPPPSANGKPPARLDMTVGELLERQAQSDALLEALEKLSADRDHWKQRARDAEKRLNVLRQALGGAS